MLNNNERSVGIVSVVSLFFMVLFHLIESMEARTAALPAASNLYAAEGGANNKEKNTKKCDYTNSPDWKASIAVAGIYTTSIYAAS